MTTLLAIETSSEACSLALILVKTAETSEQHSERAREKEPATPLASAN